MVGSYVPRSPVIFIGASDFRRVSRPVLPYDSQVGLSKVVRSGLQPSSGSSSGSVCRSRVLVQEAKVSGSLSVFLGLFLDQLFLRVGGGRRLFLRLPGSAGPALSR